MALIYSGGDWIDDGTGDGGSGGGYDPNNYTTTTTTDPNTYYTPQYNQPPPNLYVPDQTPSFDYNPETPFNLNDYQSYQPPQNDFSSWFTPQEQQSYYSRQQDFPPNLSIPSFDFNPETPFTPPNLSVPDDFKSDGSVSSMYELESQIPDYSKNIYGQTTSQWARDKYNQAPDNNSSGAGWGGPDYGTSGYIYGSDDWNGTSNKGTPSDFYQQESMSPYDSGYVQVLDKQGNVQWVKAGSAAALPQPGSIGGPLGFIADKIGRNYDPTYIDPNTNFAISPNGNGFNRIEDAAKNALTGLAGPISLFGGGVDQVADSNIPGLNVAAGAVRNAWEQFVEPLGNTFVSQVGALSNGGDVLDLLHGAGPAGWLVGGAADLLQGRDPTQYYKEVIPNTPLARLANNIDPQYRANQQAWVQQMVQQEVQNQLKQGKSPEEAQRAAERLGMKLVNPVNAAEYQGMTDFQKLPAVAQLPLMFLDPVGNEVYGGALKPLTQGVPAVAKLASDNVGLTDAMKALNEKYIESPQEKSYKFALDATNVLDHLQQIADSSLNTLPAPEVLRQFLMEKDSPYYYKNWIDADKQPLKQEVIKEVQWAYDNVGNTTAAVKELPAEQAKFGQEVQDTGQAGAKAAPTVEAAPATAPAAIMVDPVQAALDAKSQAEFDNLKSASSAVEQPPLPDKYGPLKIPTDKNADMAEFFNTAIQKQAVDVGALKLDGKALSPKYRNAEILEDWGPLGAGLRGLNKYTTQPLARLYLNTISRAARDPLTNIGKLLVEDPGQVTNYIMEKFGLGKKGALNTQYEKLSGKPDTPELGPSSITADAGTYGKTGKSGKLVEAVYTGLNPFNELTSKAINYATKGKYGSHSQFVETTENMVKTARFKRLYIKAAEDGIKADLQDALTSDPLIRENPELYRAFQNGDLTLDQLANAISGKTFNGFDLNDLANGKYNPANTSKSLDPKFENLKGGQAGVFGSILKDGMDSLPMRVAVENARILEEFKEAAGYYTATTNAGKAKALASAEINAKSKYVKIGDVVPGHPIHEWMLTDLLPELEAAKAALFPKDTRLYDASYFYANAALNYARDTGRYDMFSKALKDYVATKEGEYAVKFKAPPTDFQKMMALKDKYESGARMTPQQKAEYEAWRDKTPIRQMAADSGVKLPQNDSLFNGAKTLDDYQKIIKQGENFKSAEYDEFGGTPLTVAHQKQLAQALFDRDYTAFQKLISDIRSDRRYIQGITGEGRGKTGIWVDKSRANADRVVNRLQEYWKDANAVDTGSPGLPKTAQPVRDYTPPPVPAKFVSELPKPVDNSYSPSKSWVDPFVAPTDKGGSKEANWKIHLTVKPENREQVNKVLQDLKNNKSIKTFKQENNGGQEGKDFTVYVGSKDQTQIVANQISSKAGHLLDVPKGEALIDDIPFANKVVARFDARGDNDFAQYGSEGVPYTKDDMGQKIWGGLDGDTARANADKILRERYGEFYTGTSKSASSLPQPVAQPTKPVVTPKPVEPVVAKAQPVASPKTAPVQPGGYQSLVDAIGNPANVRLRVGRVNGAAVYGNVLTPDAMRKIASKFNRVEKTNKYGDVIAARPSRAQMNKYLHDMMATDQYYRKISNNEFKLDPDYLVPVRISDGMTLNELLGQPIPPRIGPEVPPIKDVSIEYLGEALKERYGEEVYKQDFAAMDPALRDTIIREIGQEVFGVDPLNPMTNPKAGAEHAKAIELLYELGDDMQARYDAYQKKVADHAELQDKYNLDLEKTTQDFLARRAKVRLRATDAAYKGTKDVFFDYRDKNRIDQALGSILPFQYWARQNFAYLARHFAANPYHYAALLNFYKQVEQDNNDPSIPDFSKMNIKVFDNPDGTHLMWNFGSFLPFNPLNTTDSSFGLMSLTDDDKSAVNKEPLGIFQTLFGQDKKNAAGKVVGRDKGLFSSFVNVNPVFDLAFKTGKVNDALQAWGIAKGDQSLLGQDYTEESRAQKERLGIIPGATAYREFGAATGLTKTLRNTGLPITDLDIEGPFDEAILGKNAGKPQSAAFQELASMAQKGEISSDQAKNAMEKYEQGIPAPEFLTALDRAEGDNAGARIASLIGLSNIVVNQPRSQLAGKLSKDYGAAKDDKGYYTEEVDPKTGKTKRTFVPGESQKFFDKNPGAEVLFSANKTVEQLDQEKKNDDTRAKRDSLYAQKDAGTISNHDFSVAIDALKADNPIFFQAEWGKNMGQALGITPTKPGEKQYTPGELLDQVNPIKQKQDRAYFDTLDEYKKIGGDAFDEMQKKAYALKDAGDDKGYKKILGSDAYQKAQEKRNDFLLEHPDWYKQYSDYQQKSGGSNSSGPLPPRELPRFIPKPAKTLDDIKQGQVTSKYYAIGGSDFDEMQTKAYDLKNKGDDAGFKKIVTSPEYQAAQKKRNEFIIDNPEWYKAYSKEIADKTPNPNATLPGNTPKIIPGGSPKPPRTVDDIKYAQAESEYYAKGGDEFDHMQADIKKYFDANQDNKAYDIINSREYQQVKATQNQFKKDNPDFAKRYDTEYTQKYGKPPKTEAEQIYDEQRAAYYKIGGPEFDATQKKINDLFDAGRDAEAYTLMNDRDYKRITAAQDQFKLDNPDFAKKYNADNFAKYGTTPKSDADKVYSELKGQYANIGGATYDAMSKMVSDYMDKGDKKSAGVILGSDAYKMAKAARDQFLKDNPEFAARYKAENEAKYGPSKTSTSSSSSGSSGSSSTTYKSTGRSSYSYTPKKTTTSYSSQAKSGGKSTASVSSSTPFTNAQKAAYAYARNTLGYNSTQAAGYARKVPATQTSFHTPGSSTTTKSVAALPKPTSSSVKTTKTVVDSAKNSTYNQSKSSVKTTPTSVPGTFRSVASLPLPVRSSGGGSRPKKAPSVPIHNFLPGPNTSLVRFSKRKRYK